MPVRSVSNRGRNATGRFPSIKMGRMIQFESLVELDYIYLLDYDPDVEQFEEQPITIEYRCGAKTLRYTPDFLVVRQAHRKLVECKPDEFVNTEENQRKFRAAESWCAEKGWAFCVVTATQIRSGHRLRNVKFLTRFARFRPDVIVRARIYDYLMGTALPTTVLALAQEASSRDVVAGIATVFHIVFHHELTVELDQAPVTETSFVRELQKAGGAN